MAWANRGTAHRPVVMGRRGMVASAHSLASGAGLRILQQGGDAVDAAVATAATLNVVEPYMSGIAGCGYMLVYRAKERTLQVLDYMGPSATASDPSEFASHAEFSGSPKSPLVPAACAGWLTALERYGKLDRSAVFAPAIEQAEMGAPITIKNAMFFKAAFEGGYLTEETKSVFMPGNAVPAPGAVIAQPLLAKTLREVVAGGQETFYRGELGKRIVAVGIEASRNEDDVRSEVVERGEDARIERVPERFAIIAGPKGGVPDVADARFGERARAWIEGHLMR